MRKSRALRSVLGKLREANEKHNPPDVRLRGELQEEQPKKEFKFDLLEASGTLAQRGAYKNAEKLCDGIFTDIGFKTDRFSTM